MSSVFADTGLMLRRESVRPDKVIAVLGQHEWLRREIGRESMMPMGVKRCVVRANVLVSIWH